MAASPLWPAIHPFLCQAVSLSIFFFFSLLSSPSLSYYHLKKSKMAEHKKETEAELEGIGEEAPPPYTDIVGWMAARGLEAEDEFEIDMTANAHESDDTAAAPFSQTSHPLPVQKKEKPCINHFGTM